VSGPSEAQAAVKHRVAATRAPVPGLRPSPGLESAGPDLLAAGNRAVSLALAGSGAPGDLPAGTPIAPPTGPEEASAEHIADQVAGPAGGPASTDPAQGRPTHPSGGGRPLPVGVRTDFETVLGEDLGDVRVHDDEQADVAAGQLDADAYTWGSHIVFARGQFAPGTSWGNHLLAHELAHVLTRRHGGPADLNRGGKKKKRKPKRTVTSVTCYVDRNLVVLEIGRGATLTLPTNHNGQPPPGTYRITGKVSDPPLSGRADAQGWVVSWTYPPDAMYVLATHYTMYVIAGKQAAGGSSGVGAGGGSGAQAAGQSGSGEGPAGKQDTPGEKDKQAEKDKQGEQGGTGAGQGGTKDEKSGAGTGSGGGGKADQPGTGGEPTERTGVQGGGDKGTEQPRLTPAEEQAWRDLVRLMGADPASMEDPAEQARLFRILRAVVIDPKFGDEGESWVRFARFLEKNRDRIQGRLRSGDKGKLTQDKLERILAEYGVFVAAEPTPGEGELRSVQDFNKEFAYDPGWARLSKADRDLIIAFAKASPESVAEGKVDFPRLTPTMKMIMALKVADTTFLGEARAAAKAAFTDPTFLITMVVVMAVYVGLWLTPDPSLITKIAAGALTLVMLAQFAYSDLYGFAKSFSAFSDACEKATTVPELKAAGEQFLRAIGPVGLDIMMALVFWRVGKRVGPKLNKIGAERAVVRAEATVKAVEAKPGSGATRSSPTGSDVVTRAKAAAADPAPKSVLDQLANGLEPDAKRGLDALRRSTGDAKALEILEAAKDPVRMLQEKALTPVEKAAVTAELAAARMRAARAKLVQAEIIKEPQLREQIRREQYQAIRKVLKEVGALDGTALKEAIAAKDVPAVLRALRAALRTLDAKVDSTAAQSGLAEALGRIRLRAKHMSNAAVRIVSNLVIVRHLGRLTIGDWVRAKAAELKKLGKSEPEIQKYLDAERPKLLEKDGQLYYTEGEIDVAALEQTKTGLRPLELAETKSSKGATFGAQQLAKAVGLLEKLPAEQDLRVFEQTGPRQLGTDLTSQLDVSGAKPATTTFGPADRAGFSEPFDYTTAQLEDVAKSLVRNLPPDEPPTARPPTAPREDRDEQ